MRTYIDLFKTPGIAAVVWSQLLARFALGMNTIALAVHLFQTFDNYTIAGVGIAAGTVGGAVSGPVLGRLMAKVGIRPVVLATTLTTPVLFILIGFFPINENFVVFLALVLGIMSPPIQPAARAVYPTLVTSESGRNSLFSVDAILQEIIWIVGPVVATLLISLTNTVVPFAVMAVIQLVGGLWFISLPQVHGAPIPRSTRRMGSVLRAPLVKVMIAVNLLFVGAFAALEIGAVAAVGAAQAGFVIAMLSIGSVIGGLTFGHRAKSPYALSIQLGIVLIGDLLIFFNAKDPIWLGVCLFISGIGVATAFATMGAIIGKAVKLDDTTEVYGWINSGQNIGYGLGAAIAGFVVDNISTTTAFVFATGLDGLALIVALAAVSITPSFLHSRTKKKVSE